MDIQTGSLILLSFLFASFLKGITGLGFSTICLPILASFIDPKISIPLVILPSLSSNFIVMAQAKNIRKALNRFWPISVAAIPGLIFGVYVLHLIDSSISRAILGIILIVYSLWAYRSRSFVLSKRAEVWLACPVGICNGFVNGVTGSQVVPVLPFMLSLQIEREVFVQAINQFFTFSSIIMMLLLNRFGFIDSQILLMSFIGIVPVSIGIYFGGKFRKFLQGERYRKTVLLFLLFIGISLIARGL